MHKDIRLALALASEPLAPADVAERALARAEEFGYGRRDIAALFPVLEQTPD
jgi:3-hydroxyisobutyrate dehydrogenase-like beta-hydroxyacid dehydrogenase